MINPSVKNSNLPVFYLIGCWVVYAVVYSMLKNAGLTWSGSFSSIAVVALDVVGIYYSWWLWKSSTGRSKTIFGFFALSCIAALLADFIYFLLYNILQLPHQNVSIFLLSSYNIPTVAFLCFRFLAFSSILPKIKFHQRKIANILIYTPAVIAITIISVMFFLSSKIDYQFFSFAKFYDWSELILQLACFVVVIICLAVAQNKGVFYLGLAYLIDVVAELIMNTNILAQSYGTQSFMETLWFLDSVLLIYGLVYFKRSGTYKEMPINWTYTNDSLKSQTTYWCVVAGLMAMGLSLVVNYAFFPNALFF